MVKENDTGVRALDSERTRGSQRDGVSHGGYRRGCLEHDAQCEALSILYMMGPVWKLLTGDEIRTVVSHMKMRPEMLDPTVPLGERICACGTRTLLGDKARRDLMSTWGENLGVLLKFLFPKKGADLSRRAKAEVKAQVRKKRKNR